MKMEVEVVRTRITLACTECKQRNYNMTKDKKTHPDRMETKKYCKFCRKHTTHKETRLSLHKAEIVLYFGGQRWVTQKIPD